MQPNKEREEMEQYLQLKAFLAQYYKLKALLEVVRKPDIDLSGGSIAAQPALQGRKFKKTRDW